MRNRNEFRNEISAVNLEPLVAGLSRNARIERSPCRDSPVDSEIVDFARILRTDFDFCGDTHERLANRPILVTSLRDEFYALGSSVHAIFNYQSWVRWFATVSRLKLV